MTGQVAAVSCGCGKERPVLDLDYPKDSKAQADANFVLTGDGGIVEVQGTAEDKPFSEARVPGPAGARQEGRWRARPPAAAGDRPTPNGASLHLAPSLVVATHNRGKAGEIATMLSPFGVKIVSAGDLGLPAPEETGKTFEDNATIKALAATRAAAAGAGRRFRLERARARPPARPLHRRLGRPDA